jgi:hypothetical protein
MKTANLGYLSQGRQGAKLKTRSKQRIAGERRQEKSPFYPPFGKGGKRGICRTHFVEPRAGKNLKLFDSRLASQLCVFAP